MESFLLLQPLHELALESHYAAVEQMSKGRRRVIGCGPKHSWCNGDIEPPRKWHLQSLHSFKDLQLSLKSNTYMDMSWYVQRLDIVAYPLSYWCLLQANTPWMNWFLHSWRKKPHQQQERCWEKGASPPCPPSTHLLIFDHIKNYVQISA